ncbi:hypothetical protein B0A48_02761 [Cryoendolithus antarcticus]|uniref:Uncharacterized protein n=1 Tax=Cryoendolithus antarcticus TaxID=1507870 RepID=A0A1V8TLL7_9PEZI|nr:hypothetical protein B0A48_02761 [Cryoendolithus antarcticus]
MAHRRSPPLVPVLPAASPQQGPSVPSLQTKTSDPSSAEDNGRIALLRRQSSSGTSDVDSEIASRMRKKAEPVKTDLKQKLHAATGRGEKLKRLLSDEATRSAAVRQKLEAAEERQEDLSRLMEAMRSSTDQVSTMLLARLRLGEPIEDLIDIKQEQDMYMSPTSQTGDAHGQDIKMTGVHEDWHASDEYAGSPYNVQGQQQPHTPPFPPAGFER